MNICKHEINPDTVKWHPRYGRVGKCKLCKIRMFATTIINEPKRERPHISKKQRRKNRGKK